jgi:hypothetical protein
MPRLVTLFARIRPPPAGIGEQSNGAGEDPQSFANLSALNAEFVQPADKAPRKAPKPFFVPLLKRCRVARSRT